MLVQQFGMSLLCRLAGRLAVFRNQPNIKLSRPFHISWLSHNVNQYSRLLLDQSAFERRPVDHILPHSFLQV
jgi:hypothetical protein